jgi:hypothetical protein
MGTIVDVECKQLVTLPEGHKVEPLDSFIPFLCVPLIPLPWQHRRVRLPAALR